MSQSARRNNRCIPSGDRAPACSASVQPFLRSSPATSPDTCLADGSAGGVKVTTRQGDPWITVPTLEPPAEPTGLQALNEEVIRPLGRAGPAEERGLTDRLHRQVLLGDRLLGGERRAAVDATR